MIFMGIILIFLVCHFPRILLSIYELAIIRQSHACEAAGFPPFPVSILVTISVSHFLLVFNSATNMLVYCLLSSRFREECAGVWRRLRGLRHSNNEENGKWRNTFAFNNTHVNNNAAITTPKSEIVEGEEDNAPRA